MLIEVPEFLKKSVVLPVPEVTLIEEETVEEEIKEKTVMNEVVNMNEVVEEAKMATEKVERKVAPIEKDALLSTIKGLNPEEIALILDYIPTQYIMDRINRELERGKLFEQAIQNAMQIQRGV